MSTEPIKVVAGIIETWMNLNNGQVVLAYQKFIIPTDGLLVVLTAVQDQTIISTDTFLQDNGQGGQEEVAQSLVLSEIQIDLLSFDDTARTRRFEVGMALKSIYSEEQQEANFLQIANTPTAMTDTSFLEVTKFLSRYTTRIRVTSLQQVIRGSPDYFTGFKVQLNLDPKTPQPIETDPALSIH